MLKKRRWKTTEDIIRDCEAVMNAAVEGADLRLLAIHVQVIGAATRVVNANLRHAHLTGRLRKGSSKLPVLKL